MSPASPAKKKKAKPKKKCFLISEIGGSGTPIRRRADQWLDHIYKPVLGSRYELIRADQIAAPGHITTQILENIINDDLVVIDYTGLNPNVMYEAAIRHVSRKPFIQIVPVHCSLPFDIKDLRSIVYDPEDLMHPQTLAKDLKAALKTILSPKYKVPEVIKSHIDLEPIIKDPKAFVDLLVSRLGIKEGEYKTDTEIAPGTIATVDPDWFSASLSNNKVVCPKCGTIKWIDTTVNSFSIRPGYYKCEVCGTAFEKKD